MSSMSIGQIGGVPVERFTAVLGAAYRNVGVSSVELVKPRAVHRGITAVPTEVVVVGNDVGYLEVGIVHLAHRNCRDGCQAGLVHFVNEVVQNVMVFKQILVGASDGDLVGKSPYYDGGVVVVLSYKLLHLRNSILAACGHMS